MADGLALASDGGRFHPRAALLSLVGHGLAFGVAAAFVAAPRPPEPAPSYAVLFEMPAPVERVATHAPPAPAEEPRPPQPAAAPEQAAAVELPPEPEPVVQPEPPPPPVAELAPLPAPPPKPPARPRARQSPKPAAVARDVPPAPVELPVAVDLPAAPSAEPPVQAASLPAPVAPVAAPPAPPASIPVVTSASFRAPPVPPVYPRRAVELGLGGTAVLRCLVLADGSTSEIVLWRSSGVESLDVAALGAVRHWRFEPARRDGDAIVAWVEIPVRFELN